MSTKIYNGIKIKNPGSIFDLNKKMSNISQEVIIPESIKALNKISANNAVEELVRAIYKNNYGSGDEKISIRGKIIESINDINDRRGEVSRTQRRDPVVDTDASIVVIPTKNGELLAIPFINMRGIEDLFLKHIEHEDYGYWNNSDQPDGVSDESWDQRRKAWEEAMPTDIPSESGFTFTLMRENYFYHPEVTDIAKLAIDVVNNPVSLEDIAKNLMIEKLGVDPEFKNIPNIPKLELPMKSDLSLFMKYRNHVLEYGMATEDGFELFNNVFVHRTKEIFHQIQAYITDEFQLDVPGNNLKKLPNL